MSVPAVTPTSRRQRLLCWAERRLPALTRHRRPESLPIELHRRRIYLLPTPFGLGFAALLLVMLLGALNYANNAALLLTCLIAAAGGSSMLVAFRNLDGLQLRELRVAPVVAGADARVELHFYARRTRQALRLSLDGSATETAFAVPPDAPGVAVLACATAVRGWQTLPRLCLRTTWPLGMFRAWSWLYPQHAFLVWPHAEAAGPPPFAPASEAARHQRQRGDELAALRDYRHGDSQRHVAWKASARHAHLLVKDFEQALDQREWHLAWDRLAGLDPEARIARLARWLAEAQAQSITCSVHLPGHEIPPGKGAAHYARCMDALAALP